MRIYIGSDHGGFNQKNLIMDKLIILGHDVVDCGSYTQDATDYPDFALAVGNAVRAEEGTLGVLLCRSGEGMEIAANKIPGIRAALVWRTDIAKETRQDNDANIIVIPSDFTSDTDAVEYVTTFIATPFSGAERHIRRIEKLKAIERMQP